jgi:uncharacterized PurR-regulated membrane protein YhhQ (DUF165 family)
LQNSNTNSIPPPDIHTPNCDEPRIRVFLVLSGFFLGTLALLNVPDISRFLDLSFSDFGFSIPMVVAIGVLPYQVTFLCADIDSELHGEKKARDMAWVGLLEMRGYSILKSSRIGHEGDTESTCR